MVIARLKLRLGELLLQRGLIDQEQLDVALRQQLDSGERLGAVLVNLGYVTEDEFDLQFSDIFAQINAYAAGAPIHVINPTG